MKQNRVNSVTAPDRAAAKLAQVALLGVRIHTITDLELLDFIVQRISAGQRAIVANVNVHAMNIAAENPRFRRFLNRADLVFCDGFGVKWGARLVGVDIPYRYTPPDWLPDLCETCVERDYSIFLLGARPGISQRTAQKLQAEHPGLQIAGAHHGYFDKAPDSTENREVIRTINLSRPDILVVGFGMPLQEYWLSDNWAQLEATIGITVGAALDYLAGEVIRAPSWMTDYGLEWLGRLLIEPRRLWRRYLIGNPLFFWHLIRGHNAINHDQFR